MGNILNFTDTTTPATTTCSGAYEEFGCACADSVCNEHDKICIRCQDGCYCQAGYVRAAAGGACILASSCPVIDPTPPACGTNEDYTCKCTDSVCNEPDKVCKRCLFNCYCQAGYVRAAAGGACILAASCPIVNPVCNANEEYNCKCADSVCNQDDIQCIRCADACHCKEGFVRDVAGGECIPKDLCPIVDPPPPPPNCGTNESFYCKCADSVCNQSDKVCIRCLNDCYCNEGYIRDVEGGSCILSDECP
jgi:hypothetical protein